MKKWIHRIRLRPRLLFHLIRRANHVLIIRDEYETYNKTTFLEDHNIWRENHLISNIHKYITEAKLREGWKLSLLCCCCYVSILIS